MTLRDDIGAAVGRIRGVECAPSQFADKLAWWIGGREFFHFEGAKAADVRLTRREISGRRAALKIDPRVELRSTDWVGVLFRSRADVEFVVELARVAARANGRVDARALTENVF